MILEINELRIKNFNITHKPKVMVSKSKLLAMAVAIASVAILSALKANKPVNAVDSKGWCESQGKSQNWINGCQQGWSDRDHYNSYDPDGESNSFSDGYKVG
jgi:hypothetical protein